MPDIAISWPAGLSRAERRLAVARRFYGGEVSDAMLRGYAWRSESPIDVTES